MIIDDNKEFELEDFLNEELEYSRMTPSADVWDRISKEVRPHYRWALWALTLLMLFVPYSLVMYYLPVKNGAAQAYLQNSTPSSKTNTKDNTGSTELSVRNKIVPQHNSGTIFSVSSPNTNELTGTDEQNIESASVDMAEPNKAQGTIALQHLLTSPMSQPDRVVTELTGLTAKKVISKATDNSPKAIKPKTTSKFSLEAYVTPSISYRSLSDDKSRLTYYRDIYRNNPFSDNIAAKNINTIVNQHPMMGKEIGIGTRYALNSRLKLKAGLQLNIAQYSTDAFQASGVANYAYVKNNKLDSVSANAQYATTGTSTAALQNTLYQLSLPVGIQWDCIQHNKFSIGIGATLQPTYVMEDNTYVLSTDYKYYSKGSQFTRNWNLNSAVEVSFNYTNKQITWFAAPQFRYQWLTTYQDIYSIKEHRWDIGLKVGIVKTF